MAKKLTIRQKLEIIKQIKIRNEKRLAEFLKGKK